MAHGPVEFLDRFLDPLGAILTPEVARGILAIELDQVTRARAEYLAGRADRGVLTEAEEAEYRSYIDAADMMGVLQAQARMALARRAG